MFATMQKKIRMPAMPRLLVPRNSPTSFVFSGLYLVALPSPPPPQLVLRNFATGRATASDLSSPFSGPVHAPCNSSPEPPRIDSDCTHPTFSRTFSKGEAHHRTASHTPCPFRHTSRSSSPDSLSYRDRLARDLACSAASLLMSWFPRTLPSRLIYESPGFKTGMSEVLPLEAGDKSDVLIWLRPWLAAY